MRLRTSQNRLKIEHSIIDGVRDLLQRLLAENPEIRSVIPGVIRPVRNARGEVRARVTVATSNGWKAIALSAGARQELFISTALSREDLEQRIAGAGFKLATSD
jgi:Predicted metal-binding protein